jgi:hypothetical protein
MPIPSIPRLPAGLPAAAQAALHGTTAPGLHPAPARVPMHGATPHPLLPERGVLPAATGSMAPRATPARLRAMFPKPSTATGIQNETVLQAMQAVRSRLAEGGVSLRLSHADPQLGRALGTAVLGWMALAREAAGR